MYILTWHIILHCVLNHSTLNVSFPFYVPQSMAGISIFKMNVEKTNLYTDTLKVNGISLTIGLNYVVAGSFLIPKNANTQVTMLKNLGFTKSFRYNFPESEFYSAVVDTFRLDSLLVPPQLMDLTDKLHKNKIAFFVKN